MSKPLRIDEMYAFVASDADGEGLMAFLDQRTGSWMPMVCADMSRVKSLVPIAEDLSRLSGKPFKILKFSTGTDITEEVKTLSKKDHGKTI